MTVAAIGGPLGRAAQEPSLSSAHEVIRSWQTDLERGLSRSEALVVLAIVLANAALGYLEEMKAAQAVAALARMTQITAGVLRD